MKFAALTAAAQSQRTPGPRRLAALPGRLARYSGPFLAQIGLFTSALAMLVLASCSQADSLSTSTPGLEGEGGVMATQSLASRSVTSQGVEFRALIPAAWVAPARDSESELELRCELENLTDAEVCFNLMDTLRIVLTPVGGRPLAFLGGRNGLVPGSAQRCAAARQTVYLQRAAQLKWSADGQSLRLHGTDETGGAWHIEGIRPGRYRLSFQYESSTANPNFAAGQWTGNVHTTPLEFQIQPPPEKRS